MLRGRHLRLVDPPDVVREVGIVRQTLIEDPLELSQTLVLILLFHQVRVHQRHFNRYLRLRADPVVPIRELRVSGVGHVVVVHLCLHIGEAWGVSVLVIGHLDDVIPVLRLHRLADLADLEGEGGILKFLHHPPATEPT